jgi:hypothetical protein
MECESRERNMVLKKLGKGWKVQLDVDEYIYDFRSTAIYLNKYWYLNLFPNFTPICFQGTLVTLYKKLPSGFLFIDNKESFPFITNQNYNCHTRSNIKIKNHYTSIHVIHQSWARSEEQIFKKIKNWGHRDDFDTKKHFEFWNSLSLTNYNKFKNFHPLYPELWQKLYFQQSDSVEDFILKYGLNNPQVLNEIDFKYMFKSLFNKLYRLCLQ